VQFFAALAERLLDGRVRPGDEAVERHRDLEDVVGTFLLLLVSRRRDLPREVDHGGDTNEEVAR
jgi:hypothetical protein